MASSDPSRVARGGAARLREAGIQVDVDVERDAALELNAPFFNAAFSPRPWVTLKLALSADGGIADRERRAALDHRPGVAARGPSPARERGRDRGRHRDCARRRSVAHGARRAAAARYAEAGRVRLDAAHAAVVAADANRS